MITISLCMIVKNEEDTLRRCLESIKDLVDEIVIVDTGSTDKTKDIAKEYTENIYDFVWVDNFSIARNFSFSKATMEYVMWLDADDVMLSGDRDKFLKLKNTLTEDIDVVVMKYNLLSKENGEVACTFSRERLVKREKNFRWIDPVHECIKVAGKIIKSDIAITHKKEGLPTRRNLEIFEKYIREGNELSERNWFYYARELKNLRENERAKEYYIKFLDTTKGLPSNYMDACMDLANIYYEEKNGEEALKTLLKYFEKDCIRGEICCSIGYHYKNLENYELAVKWFEIASKLDVPKDSIGSYIPLYYTYVPFMEVSLCAYKLGDLDKAIYFNELASKNHPNDKKVMRNRIVLATVKEKLVERLEKK